MTSSLASRDGLVTWTKETGGFPDRLQKPAKPVFDGGHHRSPWTTENPGDFRHGGRSRNRASQKRRVFQAV